MRSRTVEFSSLLTWRLRVGGSAGAGRQVALIVDDPPSEPPISASLDVLAEWDVVR